MSADQRLLQDVIFLVRDYHLAQKDENLYLRVRHHRKSEEPRRNGSTSRKTALKKFTVAPSMAPLGNADKSECIKTLFYRTIFWIMTLAHSTKSVWDFETYIAPSCQ